jgi:predicted RNase H-like nuclease
VVHDDAARTLTPGVFTAFRDLVAAHADAACIAIDIPIGLATGGPRSCDLEARRALGRRGPGVFPAPDPRLLGAATYAAALALARALTGTGVSKQAYAIFAKVAEVNRAAPPPLRRRLVEVHPEVSFRALGGRPMARPKGTPDGCEERRALLAVAFAGGAVPARPAAARLARPATADDVLDAIAAAWTARRRALGRAGRLPTATAPPLDGNGLRMEIVF